MKSIPNPAAHTDFNQPASTTGCWLMEIVCPVPSAICLAHTYMYVLKRDLEIDKVPGEQKQQCQLAWVNFPSLFELNSFTDPPLSSLSLCLLGLGFWFWFWVLFGLLSHICAWLTHTFYLPPPFFARLSNQVTIYLHCTCTYT